MSIDGQVCNGGFSQYYWSGYGCNALDHVKSLRRLGLNEHAAIADRVAKLFGPEGPPRKREAMMKPLATIAKQHGGVLEDADTAWYGLGWQIPRALAAFAMKHPDSFRV